MTSLIPINLLRLVVLIFSQALFFSNIHIHPMIDIYIYPVFILLLPFQVPRWLLMILGFAIGISIDMLLGTLGMHAAVSVLLAYIRPMLINVITPKGTEFELSPNIYIQGSGWFLIYFLLAYTISLGAYFMIEAGTFYNLFWLLIKIITSVSFSVISSLIFIYLFTADKRRRHAGR
jgi:hypothetical protein